MSFELQAVKKTKQKKNKKKTNKQKAQQCDTTEWLLGSQLGEVTAQLQPCAKHDMCNVSSENVISVGEDTAPLQPCAKPL